MMSASNDSNSVDPDLLTKLLDDDDADDEKFDDIELQKHENQKTASATATATSSNIKKNIVIAHAIPCDVAKQQKPLAVELYTGGGGYDGSRRRARAGTSSCCWLSVTVFGTVLLGMVSYWLYYGVLGTFVHDFAVESTTGSPHQFPIIVPMSERERNVVLQRLETFKDEINGVIGEEFSLPMQVYLFSCACWGIVLVVRDVSSHCILIAKWCSLRRSLPRFIRSCREGEKASLNT